MKKILSVVLLLAMCLSLFAGCADKDAMAALESAKDYMEAAYKDEEAVTGTEYQRGSVLMLEIDGVKHEFKVTWTTNNDKVKVIAGEGKMVTIAVPYDNLEDVSYTLTATVSDAKGNSFQMSFDRTVPARPGIPTDVEDGTYVIVVDGKSYTSLTEDKSYGYNAFHEVTVENGTVSGHYKADIITIKNVEGGFTMQDAYGRYIFMKDSHNSCNVSIEAPKEGHIWQLLTDKDGNTFIINTLKMKILAFDTGYSSWGAYPEVTDARLSKIQMIKATAPETDPEPETPDVPDVPSNVPEFVTNPEVGTGYKFALYQAKLKKYLYFTGAMDGNFFAMSENAAEAVDVYMEATEGGYYFYFLNGETKTYLSMEGYEKDGKQRASVKLTAEATTVFAYSEDAKTYVSVVGSDTFYFGTYNDFATISASSVFYITGDKASNVGVTQFVAGFCTVTAAPPTPEFVTTPEVGTGYKYGFMQVTLGKYLYFAGAMDNKFFAMTENANEAVDVYLEAAEGGYYFYFMDGETKTYLSLEGYQNDKGQQKANVKLTTEATTIFTYSEEAKTYVHAIGTEVFFLGTYGEYKTISASSIYYITGDKAANAGVTQFIAAFCTMTGAPETPETPEEPETPPVENQDPAADSTLTIEEAIALGASKESDTYTEGKYYVTGVITEVYNTKFGNMKITDANGNILTIYGTYSADGSVCYDAMEVKPIAGDTVTIYGKIGQFKGTPQIKDGWLTAHTPGEGGSTPETPEQPETPNVPETNADATITFADNTDRTVFTETQQVWAKDGITVTNDQGASPSPMGDYVAPVRFYASSTLTIEYTGMKTIKIYCNRDNDVQSLMDSIPSVEGVTVTSDGKVVTITFTDAVDSFVIETLAKQIRVDKIEIYK